MPRVVITAHAARDLERVRLFLREKNPQAAERAAKTIFSALRGLATDPKANRPYLPMEHAREMVIRFGVHGYLALYRLSPDGALVTVLAIRHQRELGYKVE